MTHAQKNDTNTPFMLTDTPNIVLRFARISDLQALNELENTHFDYDRLSRRRLRHWIKAPNGLLIVAEKTHNEKTHTHILVGYGLVLLHSGTHLARLYSLVVASNQRGQGIGQQLMLRLEMEAATTGRLFMRLEVAKHNHHAIHLYQTLGYRIFGEYTDYYEDHSDAIRMQKRIRHPAADQLPYAIPWYRQTTAFTCGPASLLMAMASQDSDIIPDQNAELDIWREATTIFMTSGHGGCHPLGLALSAYRRGFEVKAFINTDKPLFVEGVRVEHKKNIMTLADQQFRQKIREHNIELRQEELSQEEIEQLLRQGYAIIMLISTYRLDGRKVPHWVTITAIDEHCLYVHDPDPDEHEQDPLDCQHIPIARNDFEKCRALATSGCGQPLPLKNNMLRV